MHARHRSPGNGYNNRSGSMGMGFGGGSRMSPDGSARGGGHGFYNSEYRTFRNRGFGRGGGRGRGQQQRGFQQPPQLQPRKGDILMEAGRLAAEYLVSKGMLPQNALAGKWQNGSLKKVASDYRQQEAPPVQDGRVSVHSRLGTGSSDAGSSERRYADEFGSRNQFKGRRRGDYPRSYSSEWVRDSGRSSSGSERNRESPEGEGHYEVQQGSKGTDDRLQVSDSNNGLGPGKEEGADVEEPGLKKYNCLPDDSVSKASSSGAEREEAEAELVKGSEDLTDLNPGNEEMEDMNNDESENQTVPEDDISSKNGSDLLAFCNFVKIPTKIRSALTSKVSKAEQLSSNGANLSETVPPKGSEVLDQDAAFDDPLATTVEKVSEMNDPKDSDAELSQQLPLHCAEDNKVSPVYGSDHGKCIRSQSFSDGGFDVDSEFETSNETVKFGRSSSVKERGEKRPADDGETSQQQKKPRESLLPAFVPNVANELTDNLLIPKEEVVSIAQQPLITESSLGSCRECPEDVDDDEYAQEKQQFPGSFKTCDLNLMEASDIHDNTSNEPVLLFPPVAVSQAAAAAANVDVDLSMSNRTMLNEYVRHVSSGKEIEVIDLENDDLPPGNEEVVGSSQNKMEVEFSGTEGFTGTAQAAGHITDVQDNYDGLIISEFLSSFSSCTSVTEGINPLQNEMGLHHAEGSLGYDDSIYTSLEEIPLSFIPDWEQPTPQGFEKPF